MMGRTWSKMPVKEFFRNKFLANRTNRVYRASVSMFSYAGAGTIIAALVYFLCGLRFLSAFVVLGGLIFFSALFIYIRGFYKAGVLIALLAVSLITVAGDTILGVECGVHYFLLAGVILFISADKTTVVFRYICCFVCFLEFILICVFLVGAEPVTVLPSVSVYIIDKINLLTAFGAIGFAVHNYVNAVLDKEIIQKGHSLRLLDQANSDPLTGLPNRRFTYRQLELFAAKALTRNNEIVIGLADIDDFKCLNDTYGHLCGDEVLVQAGTIMKSTLRVSDIVGRWGGEEFLVILPNTGYEEGIMILERLRKSIEDTEFIIEGQKLSVTMTIGVSVYKKNARINDLIHDADKLLYKGKSKGKNCVMVCD